MMGNTTVRPTHRSRALAALSLAAGMALSVAALAPVSVAAQDATVMTSTTDLGTFLTDKDGKTLYFFGNDTAPGVSTCTGDCLTNWPLFTVPDATPPVAGEGVTGVLGTVEPSEGTYLVTYDGRPLYYFAGDAAAGDTNGQGKGDIWYVALEDGSIAAGGAPTGEPGLTLAAATGDLGTYLTGTDGKTLYFFRPDSPGVSVCDADCMANWPPATFAEGQIAVAGEGVTGVVNMTTTTDGQPIATYDGRPLYYFANDAAAGDTNGQGLGDVWFVAATDGSMPAPAPAEAAASPAAAASPMASPAAAASAAY